MSAYYNEIDPFAAAWLRELIKAGEIADGDVDERSIADVQPDDVRGYTQCHFFAGIGGWSYALRLAGWPDDRPVWTGSCPCQPFSGAGRHDAFEDERDLWPTWLPIIRESDAPVIFGEQVAGPDGVKWLSRLRADMESDGRAVGAANLCAAGVGAPQIRQRLWWVADPNHAGRQGRERQGQPHQAREEWQAPRRQLVRSTRGPWPPGPGAVGAIPVCADGHPHRVGRLRGYGNAIVPQVAAEFIGAYLEVIA